MTLKAVTIFVPALCAGAMLGVALAVFGPFTRSPDHTPRHAVQSTPSTGKETPLPSPSGIAPTVEAPVVPSPVAPAQRHELTLTSVRQQQAIIARLSRQLDQESAARQRLEEEVSALQVTLQMLEQRLDGLTERRGANDTPLPRVGGFRQIDAATFLAAGFDQNDAAFLTDRWGQQQMDLLYLRDQAIREGWIDTPRYTQARRELSSGVASLRAEIGPAAYDRFLFATGQSNRVVINAVIDNSPAQNSGLLPGDTIVTYDRNPIYSVNDLRAATTAGEPDVPVVMEVDRGGQLVELEIARGPLGVTLNSRRVEP